MPFSRSEKDTTMQILTNIMKWSAIPALLVISILSRFAAGYGFVADIAICIGAVVFVHWAVRAKTYFWAAGFVPVAVVFSPLPLPTKIFLLLGFICTGIFLTMYSVFRTQLAPA